MNGTQVPGAVDQHGHGIDFLYHLIMSTLTVQHRWGDWKARERTDHVSSYVEAIEEMQSLTLHVHINGSQGSSRGRSLSFLFFVLLFFFLFFFLLFLFLFFFGNFLILFFLFFHLFLVLFFFENLFLFLLLSSFLLFFILFPYI